ncbi:MAG TPA: murein biosynthesis integral membrane protein MurJ [Candidatus Acidoferrales bacterium]
MTEKRQILQSASAITLATIISRILGYLRDERITLLLGTSVAADSFILAFRIPNLLRRLIGEGSMTAAFIPVFTGYITGKSRTEIWEFAQRAFWTLTVLLAPLTVLGVVFSDRVMDLFTLAGGHRIDLGLAVYLNRIIFPYVFFVGLSALAMAILNSYNVFGLPASTPIVFNLTLITFSFAAVYTPIVNLAPPQYRSPAVALAVAVLLAGALQFFMQVPALLRRGMRFHFQISLKDRGIRTVAKLMIPSFFGIGLYQINFFVDTIFAMSPKLPQGSITSLYVADRVVELVLGSFALAISTALLPTLSRQANQQRLGDMTATFGYALRLVSFVTIPAAVGLALLRQPIVRVLFQHGQFVAASTALTTRPLLCYSLGLPAFAGVKLIVPVFYSLRDTATPVRVAAVALCANILLNVGFLFFLAQRLSNAGPALATAIAAYVNFGALFVIFRGRFGRVGATALLASLGRTIVCALAMAVACILLMRGYQSIPSDRFLPQAAGLAAIITAAVAIYMGAAWLMRCEEVHEVIAFVRSTMLAGRSV